MSKTIEKKKWKSYKKLHSETTELVKEGYSLDKAMELAGYSESMRKTQKALVTRTLEQKTPMLKNQMLNNAILGGKRIEQILLDDKAKYFDWIKATESTTKGLNVFMRGEQAPSAINYYFQTNIDKQLVQVKDKDNE